MYKKLSSTILLLMMSWLIVACQETAEKYELGDVLLEEDFSAADSWETFGEDDVSLQVSDGAYRITTSDGGYIWGLNELEHSDVVIEVTTTQVSTHDNNAYGVMCRANTENNGDGYYFLISGDGYYSIAMGEGESVNPIVRWTEHSAVNEGTATNKLRAVCVGDYLALYVNDELVTEIEDTTFTNGYTGLAAAAFAEGDADITFDDLTIWSATMAN